MRKESSMSMSRGLWGALLPALLLIHPTFAQHPDAAPAPETSSMPLVMPGYASLEGFRLTAPGGMQPLSQRHIEVIAVVGEVDPPFADGDDRIDLTNPEYNEPRFKELMNGTPGMVTATMTIWIEEQVPTDNKIQVWEKVLVRVFNADKKEDATHYCDSSLWKAQPGFVDLTPEQLQFGTWQSIASKQKANSKFDGRMR